MKTLLRIVLRSLCLSLLFPGLSMASHLMGGNLYYQSLGQNINTGQYDYLVTLELYRYCEPGSTALPNTMNLGVYQDNPVNLTGDKLRVSTAQLTLISSQFITPPNSGDSCTFAPNVCVEQGIYQVTISVPASSSGYYLIADRCCRNGNIVNIDNPGTTGQAYYAMMPGTNKINSAPSFAVAPVPFICAGDTVTVLNQAFDADGDLLTYTLATPYSGISSNMQPAPTPPNPYTWPIPNVNYAAGYSFSNPFGPGSYASIDSSTGLATYVAPNQGFYVVAVEIKEYRNGILIGVTRRDIQLIVIACPVNPAPSLSSSATNNFTIQEGQPFCLNISFSDANGDSVFLSHIGNIFDSLVVNPPATFTNTSGASGASSQFCWTPSCSAGRAVPYQFSVNASDNGCPAKTTNIVYTITVQSPPSPTSIRGVDTLCVNSNASYSVSPASGYSYQWFLQNGTLVSGEFASTVNGSFQQAGTSTVSVVATNAYGCTSDTLDKFVHIKPLPTTDAGSDVAFCTGDTMQIGSASLPGYTYTWTPSTGLSSTSISNPVVTLVNNGNADTIYRYIVTAAYDGCSQKDTVLVTVHPKPIADGGAAQSLCSGSSIHIGVASQAGATYLWTPGTGLNDSLISNPVLTLTNTNNTPDSIWYYLSVESSFGCANNDSVLIAVNPVPTADAGLDSTTCSGTQLTIGTSATSGYSYIWSPASGLSSVVVSDPLLTTLNSGSTVLVNTYQVVATWFGCKDTDQVQITVLPLAPRAAGSDLQLCSAVAGQLGQNPVSNVTYSWTPGTGLSDSLIANPIITLLNNGSAPDTLTYYLHTELNGCLNDDTVQVIVNPVPVAEAGIDTSYCSGQQLSIGATAVSGYSYTWSPATGLSSSSSASPTVSATNTGTSPLVINYQLITTWFGCRDTDHVAVTVKPNPIANAGEDQLLCSGATITLGAGNTSGYVYTWSPATGLSDPNISNPTVSLLNTNLLPDTLFYVVETELNGCFKSDTVRVISSPVPTAVAGSDVSICSGASASLGDVSTANYQYTWTPSSGLNQATVSNPVVTLTNNGVSPITQTYQLVTNLFGCRDTDQVDVEVRPLPVSNAGADQLLCSDDTIQLGTSNNASYTYNWSPANGLNSTTTADPTLTLSNQTNTPDTLYYTVVTELNGCTTTDSVRIVNSPVPVANAGIDKSFCSGASTTLGAAAVNGYQYSWTPTGVLVGAQPTLTQTNATQVPLVLDYYLSVNWFGCTDVDTVQVTVKPLPVSEAGAATVLCFGDSAVLGTSNNVNYTYSWSPASGLNSTTVSNPQVTASNQGPNASSQYYTVVTDFNGCTTHDSVLVTENPLPSMTAAAADLDICIGSSTAVSVSGSTATYSWTVSGSTQVISTASSFTVNPTSTTTYVVEAISGASCRNKDSVTVTVHQLPVVSIVALNDTICRGDTLLLNGNGAQDYSWSVLNGTSLGTGNSIGVSPINYTTYVVVGTDAFQCSASDTFSVSVNPSATLTGLTGTVSLCPGVTGVQYWINGSNASSTYTWTVNPGSIASGQGTDTIAVDWSSVAGPGTVTVFETTDRGCESKPAILPVNINVLLTPVAPSGPDTLCQLAAQGISYQTLSTPGSVYTWHAQGGTVVSGNGTPQVVVDWTATGPTTVALWYDENSTTVDTICFGVSDTFYVHILAAAQTSAVQGNNSVCINDTVSYQVGNTAGSTYAWQVTGGTLQSGNGSNQIQVVWTAVGQGSVQVTETNSEGCLGVAVVSAITVHDLPNANAGSDTSFCRGASVQLQASGGVSYSWSPTSGLSSATQSNPTASPAATTDYSVLVTDQFGCKKSDLVKVTVNELPNVSAGSDAGICLNNSTQLNASGASTYVWSPAATLSSATASNPTATPLANTTYMVVGTDNNGCSKSDSVVVTVYTLPVANAGVDTLVCEGSGIMLQAGGGVAYQWSPASGLSNTSISNPIASPSNLTTYTVLVTDVHGCTDTDDLVVSVNDQPQADFSFDQTNLTAACEGITVKMVNASQDALTYLWYFGDNASSTDENPSHAFAFAQTTNVTLVAINNSCRDSIVKPIDPGNAKDFIDNLANVFTPNGDGVNDCFSPNLDPEYDACSSWHVFNRWGEVVFNSGSFSRTCWDGKENNKGVECPNGTYFFVLEIAGSKFQGSIQLIR